MIWHPGARRYRVRSWLPVVLCATPAALVAAMYLRPQIRRHEGVAELEVSQTQIGPSPGAPTGGPAIENVASDPPGSTGSPEPEEPDVNQELHEPLLVEQAGMFQKAYSEWESEEEDERATREALDFFRNAFSRLGIHPESQYIRCGDALCRARFRYETLKKLYRMLEIGEPDGMRVASTFPEQEGGLYTVSIYWTRNESPEGSLTETAGR